MRIGLLGIVLIPALYAFICLESVWDTASRTSALPALTGPGSLSGVWATFGYKGSGRVPPRERARYQGYLAAVMVTPVALASSETARYGVKVSPG